MKTVRFIFLLPFLLLVKACHDYDPPYFYETVSMSLSNVQYNAGVTTPAGDSVPKNVYAIQLNLTSEPREHEGADSYESEFRNEDQVSSFLITSSDTFNGIAPNLSLNHLFKIKTGYGEYELSTGYGRVFTANNPGVDVPSSWNTSNYLLLKITPYEGSHQTFYVSGTLDDGRILSDSISVELY